MFREIARDGEEAAARKPRRAKTADAGGEEYAPAPKKSVRREKPAAPAQTAPAAGDESAAPRRKLKTKIQTEPRPEIPDFSKMSNEGPAKTRQVSPAWVRDCSTRSSSPLRRAL